MNSAHIAAFHESGYVVVRGAVGLTMVEDVLDAIERRRAFLNTRDAKAVDQALLSGFFPMWNHSALWRVRELRTVREAFETIYDSQHLWVSLDRCGYRLPGSGDQGSLQLHWDADSTRWDFAAVQGLVALTNAARHEGGFVCAPDLYRVFRDKGKAIAGQLLEGGAFEMVDVELAAGDVLLFDYRLAHGTAKHQGSSVRAVQYVAFVQAGGIAEKCRRINCWETGAWRGRASLPVYGIPDESSPPLSGAGWRALTGDGPHE